MKKVFAFQVDITQLEIDVIVNAANRSLLGGGGVNGAIHRAAGSDLLVECKTLGGCNTGDVKITKGYNLPAKHVVHAVGPVWAGGTKGEAKLLATCYRRSLELAQEKGLKSIAFPCISTGVYRFPKEQAAKIAVETIKECLQDFSEIEKVIFACFSLAELQIYQFLLAE